MKHITILYPEGQRGLNTIACVVGTVEILARANDYWIRLGNRQKYQVVVAGTSAKHEYIKGLVRIKPDALIGDIPKTDLIVIPAVMPAKETKNSLRMSAWITGQYRRGAEVASMCSGTFILAGTGLLDGKTCSTHWSLTNVFREKFPKVDLRSDQLITDEKGIYTNGGAYSFLNLVIYLVEKYYDRNTAIYCSKIFQVELERNSQSAFAIFTPLKQHGDKIVQQAQVYLENNFDEKISIEKLASRFAVGRRNFDRRFIKATGNTPLEYSQRVRIEAAKRSLENTRKTISEVMYEAGYSDVKAFREVFKKFTGSSPLEYRNKFNKESM